MLRKYTIWLFLAFLGISFSLNAQEIPSRTQEKQPAFLWLEAKALVGSTPTLNNIIFVPGVAFEAKKSFYRKKSMAISAGLGYKHFRGINGIPVLGALHIFPKGKKEHAHSWFAGTGGYTFAWNTVPAQTRDKLRGGIVAQIEWGRKIRVSNKAFASFSIGYQTQQVVQQFFYPNQEARRESLFYHFLTLSLGVGKE